MCKASRIEQSIRTPPPRHDGTVYESSSQLHCSDITDIVDWMTLYHMIVRADNQHIKQALQIALLFSEIVANVVAFPKKGAHLLQVVRRVQLSAFLMMDSWPEQWD